MSDEASSLSLLLDGIHAGTGSRIQSRVRRSRHGNVVVAAGLFPTPGVAASRMGSKLAGVGVAAAEARIHARRVFQIAVECCAELPVSPSEHARKAAREDLGDVVVEGSRRGAGNVGQ